jgi:AcrR family transcriptional regulator
MSRIVDHRERRRQVLASALNLFAEEGYAAVTYQKLADRCGLARTGLYRYYRTKRDILEHALAQMADDLAAEIGLASADADRPVAERIETVLTATVAALVARREALGILLEYLLRPRPGTEAITPWARRQALGMRLLLRHLVRDGVRRGELTVARPTQAADMLFALLEAAVLDAAVTGMLDARRFEQVVRLAIRGCGPGEGDAAKRSAAVPDPFLTS